MLISIIIATFNSGKTLARCLNSIVKQLNNDCELIVIDGGSSDNTLDIISDYKDYIAYYVSEKDKGVYDAWNKGVKVAKGRWITFIGSDDEMLPKTISYYYDFFKANGENYDIILGKLHFIDNDGKVIRNVGEPWDWDKFVKRKMSLAHPCMLTNSKCFDRIGLFNIQYRICADSDFLQRLGKNTKAGFIDHFLVNMAEGGISDSSSALYEGYITRRNNKVINPFVNILVYVQIWCRVRIGRIIKKIH